MSDIFGLGLPTPFAFFDPNSSSWRMSQATLDWDSTPSSPTLPGWGEMHDGALSERPTPAHLTGGRDSSSYHTLPTPTASQPGGTAEQHLARKNRMPDGAHRTLVTDLRMVVELLPSPTARDHKGRNQRDDESCLPGAVNALLPTPTARLGTPRGAQAARYSDPERSNDLDDAVLWMSEQIGNGLSLPSDSGRPSWEEQRLPL